MSDVVCMPRHLWACVAALFLLCTPAHAEEEYSALRAFGIDEIRLGGMQHNLDVRNNQSGIGYTVSRESGIDVNGEVLFTSPWPQPANPIVYRSQAGRELADHDDDRAHVERQALRPQRRPHQRRGTARIQIQSLSRRLRRISALRY